MLDATGLFFRLWVQACSHPASLQMCQLLDGSGTSLAQGRAYSSLAGFRVGLPGAGLPDYSIFLAEYVSSRGWFPCWARPESELILGPASAELGL